jgi:hypothetical protein
VVQNRILWKTYYISLYITNYFYFGYTGDEFMWGQKTNWQRLKLLVGRTAEGKKVEIGGGLISRTWKLVMFILTRVHSYQHHAMKCFWSLGVSRKCVKRYGRTKSWSASLGGGRRVVTVQSHTITTTSSCLTASSPQIFLTPLPTATGDAGRQASFSSARPSVCLYVWSLTKKKKKKKKLTSFDRLFFWTRPFPLGDGDSRKSEHQ